MSRIAAISRRNFLRSAGGIAVASVSQLASATAAGRTDDYRLVVKPAYWSIRRQPSPRTIVWSYNGSVPGSEIRVKQGDRLRVRVENQLGEGTTVHWHGLRVPNAMDGVPDLTQPSIAPGADFTYEFEVLDAGTYMYHSHQNSPEQIGRGLYGPLIIEESAPPTVDRDIVWVLSDFRLLPDGSIADGFENRMEMAMSGRVGNTVTINGQVPETFLVRAGERIRLRLINAASARIFGLEFRGHQPVVIAYDGQPVEPHAPGDDQVVLGPAMRVDLILDAIGKPGETYKVVDTFYDDLHYDLADIAYASQPAAAGRASRPIALLPRNTMPEPDLAKADRHSIVLGGGMMGGTGMGGDMMGMMRGGAMWSINGVGAMAHDLKPMITIRRGTTALFAIRNETAWFHPIHLHGHSFRVVVRNGTPTRYREWRDTVLVPPRESADIAFVADNPGDWMIHCHVLDHQEGGMMAVIRVT